MSREVYDGIKFGAGAYLGWTLVRWGVLVTLFCVGSCAVCTYALAPQNLSKTEGIISEVEETLDFNIMSPKQGLKAGDDLAYKYNCVVRRGPGSKHKVVGVAKARKTYKVIERRGSWRKIVLSNGTVGWSGCGAKL